MNSADQAPCQRYPKVPWPPATASATPGGGKVAFSLFVRLNAILFVRPSDMFPDLESLSLYEKAILVCMLFSAGALVRQISAEGLRSSPITCCVIGLLGAVVLSHLAHTAPR